MVSRHFLGSSESSQAESLGRSANAPPRKRAPEVLDRQSIETKALGYLDRFDASAARLRRVLTDFVKQHAKTLQVDPAPFMTIVAQTIERYQKNGLINDQRYGAAMARSLVERGASQKAIRAKLFARGLSAGVVDEVLKELSAQGKNEILAACALVRKRKLGNCRPEAERRENYRRDLRILARAGFDFDTAKRALAVEGADGDDVF